MNNDKNAAMRPSDASIAKAFYEQRDPGRPMGEQWPLYGIEKRARELDAAQPAQDTLVDAVAKALADAHGHGMREKCEVEARRIVESAQPSVVAVTPEVVSAPKVAVSEDDVKWFLGLLRRGPEIGCLCDTENWKEALESFASRIARGGERDAEIRELVETGAKLRNALYAVIPPPYPGSSFHSDKAAPEWERKYMLDKATFKVPAEAVYRADELLRSLKGPIQDRGVDLARETAYRARVTQAEQQVSEWKARFDALLERTPKVSP